MVLVDTSVWIKLFRRRDAVLAQRLSSLVNQNLAAICGQVWVELIGGFRSRRKREEYGADLRIYPWLETTRDAFYLAAQWRATHGQLGSGDVIIAATASVHGASLLTLDRAFMPLRSAGLRVELAET